MSESYDFEGIVNGLGFESKKLPHRRN